MTALFCSDHQKGRRCTHTQEWRGTYAFITYIVIAATICFSQWLKRHAGITPPPRLCFSTPPFPSGHRLSTSERREQMKVRQILYTVGGQERHAVMTIMIIYEMLLIPR